VRVNIKLILEGKEAKDFNSFKGKLGLVNNTDVLRYLIKQADEIFSRSRLVEVKAA
jgi:hypothetical protein